MASVLSKIVRLIVSSEGDNLETRVTRAVLPQRRHDDVITVTLLRVLPPEIAPEEAKLTPGTFANTQQCIISRSTRRDSVFFRREKDNRTRPVTCSAKVLEYWLPAKSGGCL